MRRLSKAEREELRKILAKLEQAKRQSEGHGCYGMTPLQEAIQMVANILVFR